MKLQNKVATITGAASGIGRAAAILFANEGAKVVLADVNETGGNETLELIKADGGDATFIRTDVSETSQVKALIARALASYGKLDIMYNNAGVGGRGGGVADIAEEVWDKMMSVNLRGVYLCCKYGVPELIKAGGGSIVNQSSVAAISGGGPPLRGPITAYAATKGGVISLTNAIAYAYGHQGIRANTILPGLIETGMTGPMLASEAYRKEAIEYIPLRRIGRPEEVANVALFLASDDSSYVSAAAIVVDGAYIMSQGPTSPQQQTPGNR
jgi:NAD(P)-dependent dehydrogenase (short-subunit alcohol dehydrogenase family)